MKQVSYPSRGHTAFGFAHIPDACEPVPAVILCHGFTGCAAENSRLFVRFAERARQAGIYVLRADFLGSGNSELDEARYTTPSGWVEDILSGLSFLQEQPEVDRTRLGVLGISLGGYAALLAGSDPRVRAVAAWNPVLDPAVTFRGILTEENWDRLLASECAVTHSYAGARFTVRSDFARDFARLSVQKALREYSDTSVLILQGTADQVINPRHSLALCQAGVYPIQHRFVEGEDHSFLRRERENFDETLRFLCDAFAK